MNYRLVLKILGNLLIVESLLMIPSLLVASFTPGSDELSFIITMLILVLTGFLLSRIRALNDDLQAMEGLAIVAGGWFLFSLFGALPFVISGSIPSYIDALFETVSGFTTTGATILQNVEIVPKGLLFWRSFTHWVGGMGILVFTLALLPTLKVGGFQIFKAESPGPVSSKIAPKIKDTAKILYLSYLFVTLAEIILLCLGGMPLFDSAVHTFGSVGTGGFSIKNASIGAYHSTYLQMVIAFFMILSGGNFGLYFALYKGRAKEIFKDEEMRLYLTIILLSTLFIALNVFASTDSPFGISVRDALFQTGSIITTTGYATTDFDAWPSFSKGILFLLMFIGGCTGSTGGAIKNIRILVMLKLIKREVAKIFHPRGMIPIKVNGKSLNNDTVAGISSFFALYILTFVLGTLLISLEGIDLESAASSVAATLGNIGPGLGLVGPTKTFAFFNDGSKLIFSVLMLLGRLELFTIIAFLSPHTWRNRI